MSTQDDDDTIEESRRGGARSPGATRDYLFVALESDRPGAGGARYALDGVDEVVVGRGPRREVSVTSDGGVRRLELRLPGRALSAVHARIARASSGWLLADAGSTNGCYVNGRRVTTTELRSDAIVELGRTFFLIRKAEALADAPALLDSDTAVWDLPGFPTLVPELARRFDDLRRVARSAIPVLLSGETGTGKEVLARAIHAASERREFSAVNCGALTESLAESQLFGHVRGAFSGANSDSLGFLRAAEGGTLLLDEVQELRPSAQAALLRVLQEREVIPIGGFRPIPVDVRIIAASSTPLHAAVQRGAFRPDLFARLSGFHCALPPLRERREDLGLLIACLLRKIGVEPTRGARLSPELSERLLSYPFPLNVRELEQFLKRAWVLASDGVIDDATFAPTGATIATNPAEASRSELASLSDDERVLRDRLLVELERSRGNVAAVARQLGKAPMQIRRWVERFAIDLERFRLP